MLCSCSVESSEAETGLGIILVLDAYPRFGAHAHLTHCLQMGNITLNPLQSPTWLSLSFLWVLHSCYPDALLHMHLPSWSLRRANLFSIPFLKSTLPNPAQAYPAGLKRSKLLPSLLIHLCCKMFPSIFPWLQLLQKPSTPGALLQPYRHGGALHLGSG